MKKIYKTSTKVWLNILCSLSAVLMLLCMIGTVVLAEYDAYSGHAGKIEKDLYEKAGETYALWALANYHGGELDSDVAIDFDGTGFKYGIYHGTEKAVDSNSTFVDSNFTGELPEDYKVRTYALGERPTYYLSDRLLIGNEYDSGLETAVNQINIKGIGYDDIDDTVYIWDGEQFYSVAEEFAYPMDPNDYWTDENEDIDTAYQMLWEIAVPDITVTQDYVYYTTSSGGSYKTNPIVLKIDNSKLIDYINKL